MRGEGVPQRMRRHRLGDTGPPGCFPACLENGFRRERTASLVSGEKPVGGALPTPVSDQYLAEGFRQHDPPVLVALAVANPDDLPVAVQVAHFQMSRFR